MHFAIIDCGTTNSRVYILNDHYQIINSGVKRVGVKDTAISGSNEVLKKGLKELFEQTVVEAGLKLGGIEFAVAFGMITSEIGLLEIPHLWAPVGLDDLSSSVKIVKDLQIFPVDIPLVFVRGIKNYFPEHTTYKDLRKIDFMRGEETQVAGLLSSCQDLKFPLTMVMLSSHTKYIYINENKKICGSLTTLSGQVYEAISKETFIGKSINGNNYDKYRDYFNAEIIDIAYDSVKNTGFIRTLMMPRFMEVLLQTKWYERKLFFEAAIAAEDLHAVYDYKLLNFSTNCHYVLVGHKTRCDILKYLLTKEFHIPHDEIKCIHDKEQNDRLSIEGAIAIAKGSGFLKEA